jgi:hypothetical protein
VAGVCAGAEGEKKAEIDESKTAIVWVNVPGFIKSKTPAKGLEKGAQLRFGLRTGNARRLKSRNVAQAPRGSRVGNP